MRESGRKYENLYGYWDVTTEGDCEGRTTKFLGTYKGWIDEIALHLADKCFYSLQFRKLETFERSVYTTKKKAVNVMLDIDSGTWEMEPDERKEYIQTIFNKNKRDVYITKGNFFASFVINTEKEDINERKKKILEKLSGEEIELLGIKI